MAALIFYLNMYTAWFIQKGNRKGGYSFSLTQSANTFVIKLQVGDTIHWGTSGVMDSWGHMFLSTRKGKAS